eukprot:scaffold6939_cov42-Prasinocladus_malaysianus.AAC.3
MAAAAAAGVTFYFVLYAFISGTLAELQDPDIMTDRQIRNELHTMLFAGSDTTANTLSWMFFEMARRPEIME